MTEQSAILDMTSDIVSAYLSKNTVRASEIAELISTVHGSLTGIAEPKTAEEPAAELKPAVPVKKSVTDDYIISLEDGRKFKSMKRHLGLLGMTPDQYRAKWNLPADYPMVAPGYAARRSALAKSAGLGSSRRAAAQEPVVASTPEPAAPPEAVEQPADEAPAKRRGRPKKAA